MGFYEAIMIEINKAHFPVTVLGPGRRIGIWLQGCSIRCQECVSQDTWENNPELAMPVTDLVNWCRWITGGRLDGVTISGGEPFDQPQALAKLLDGLRCWANEIGVDFDLLCYSGYPLTVLQNRHAGILAQLDAVIPEPYMESSPGPELWRGSMNQPVVPLSELGERRYNAAVLAGVPASKAFQVTVDGYRIWYIGIPDRGDMERMAALCRERGLTLGSVSWRV